MKTLLENNILKMEYNKQRLFLKNTWIDESYLDDEVYKESILIAIEEVKKLNEVRYMLSNTAKFNYVISVDIQNWVAERLFPVLAQKKLKRSALITTLDIFAQVSIEQLTEENKVAPIQRMYFKEEKEAIEWLFKENKDL